MATVPTIAVDVAKSVFEVAASEAQQTLSALHRLRSTWLAARTARLNTVRGLLREFGVAIAVGARHVRPTVATLLADADTRYSAH